MFSFLPTHTCRYKIHIRRLSQYEALAHLYMTYHDCFLQTPKMKSHHQPQYIELEHILSG